MIYVHLPSFELTFVSHKFCGINICRTFSLPYMYTLLLLIVPKCQNQKNTMYMWVSSSQLCKYVHTHYTYIQCSAHVYTKTNYEDNIICIMVTLRVDHRHRQTSMSMDGWIWFHTIDIETHLTSGYLLQPSWPEARESIIRRQIKYQSCWFWYGVITSGRLYARNFLWVSWW